GDRVSHPQHRQPALQRGDGRARFHEGAGRYADSGAAPEVQADIHGCAAALHRATARISTGALATEACADACTFGFRHPLHRELEFELESALLSERRLVLQSTDLA